MGLGLAVGFLWRKIEVYTGCKEPVSSSFEMCCDVVGEVNGGRACLLLCILRCCHCCVFEMMCMV